MSNNPSPSKPKKTHTHTHTHTHKMITKTRRPYFNSTKLGMYWHAFKVVES